MNRIDYPEFIEPENKALIGAAPDLLSACEVALELLEKFVQGRDVHELLHAAIAKAKAKPVESGYSALYASATQRTTGTTRCPTPSP